MGVSMAQEVHVASRTLSGPRSSVAIVMMDSRRPEMKMGLTRHNKQEMTTQAQGRLLTLFTYYLNFKYACRHGYKLLFYKLASTDCDGRRCVTGCTHPIWGERHPSYCKLSAIAAALAEGYETVAYIDSDAFFQNATHLPGLLSAHDASDLATQTRIEPHAFFGWDWPYTLGPNMGLIVLRNTEISRELLRVRRFTLTMSLCIAHARISWQVWWHVHSGDFGLRHPFEQRTLTWDVMHRARFRHRIRTLSLRPMDPGFTAPVLHLDHTVGTKTRIWVIEAPVKLVPTRDRAGRQLHSSYRAMSFRQARARTEMQH